MLNQYDAARWPPPLPSSVPRIPDTFFVPILCSPHSPQLRSTHPYRYPMRSHEERRKQYVPPLASHAWDACRLRWLRGYLPSTSHPPPMQATRARSLLVRSTHTHTCQTVHGLNYLLAHFAPLGDLLLYVRILELRFDFILQDRSSITHVFSRYCNPLGLLGP
ncbi:uncharacterized protein CCOS01_01043 [Colletotrichum costaricense]|uniref:Uncharacterized protein n=1 Tax=Colletotrichum costaricense TaxID=1209916 RepID=A0AAI9ZAT3_9PEZI|nr:uncharacterized protein CCOS01_01043 [Colletotrichum costaricense]KAK1539729.1 hypothetical protein CCOS01_01043 [Colletotrichum costaricense]